MSHPSCWKLPASGLAGLLLATTACNQQPAASQTAGPPPLAADTTQARQPASAASATAAPFGRLSDGTAIPLYTLRNAHGLTATISPYDGTLTSLRVPNWNGKLGNIVLGFDSLAGYTDPVFQKENPCFGALIGRYGNRSAKGQFILDGHTYHLPINNPPNSLHGGTSSFNRRVWTATPGTSSAGATLTLSYLSKDGEEGYPGNLMVQVTYTLTNADVLRLDYRATTDKPTVLNLTNHTYFNLNCGQDSDILGHVLTLNAGRFTPVDNTLIPTGKLATVAGTPFDFRQPHAIGERLARVPGAAPGGYDHNWVLVNQMRDQPALAATVYEPASGRTMQVYTDQPGVQFYSGNFLKGNLTGKGGVAYAQHYGFCLETNTFPNRPTNPASPVPCCDRANSFTPPRSTLLGYTSSSKACISFLFHPAPCGLKLA